MLLIPYSRNAFLKYLKDIYNCDIITVKDSRVIHIKNNHGKAYMIATGKNVIDYEEIYIVCQKLNIPIPGDNDLKD
jgi:hypothetical protein